MKPPADRDHLVEKARRGDRQAFAALFRSHEGELRGYAARRIGAHLRRFVTVDDVLQETAARALQAVTAFEYRGERSFQRWLHGIAEHVILREVRRHAKGRILYLEPEVVDPGASPSRVARREERFDRFQHAVAQLPDDYREVVRLVSIEGLRVKDAAERLGRSPNSVTKILGRALAELRRRFGDTESLTLPR